MTEGWLEAKSKERWLVIPIKEYPDDELGTLAIPVNRITCVVSARDTERGESVIWCSDEVEYYTPLTVQELVDLICGNTTGDSN